MTGTNESMPTHRGNGHGNGRNKSGSRNLGYLTSLIILGGAPLVDARFPSYIADHPSRFHHECIFMWSKHLQWGLNTEQAGHCYIPWNNNASCFNSIPLHVVVLQQLCRHYQSVHWPVCPGSRQSQHQPATGTCWDGVGEIIHFYFYDGKFHHFLKDWRLPPVGVLDMWLQWWIGNGICNIPPVDSSIGESSGTAGSK